MALSSPDDPRVLIAKVKTQTAANRYAFLLKTADEKVVQRVVNK